MGPVAERTQLAFSGKRHVVLIPTHSLRFVKACKDAAGVSVNDVVMAATAGAVRRYCEAQNDPLFAEGAAKVKNFKALVPVALPMKFDAPQEEVKDVLTNNWCFCSAGMPIGENSPLARVRATCKEMGRLKNSMKPLVGLFQVNVVMPKLPVKEQQKAARDLFSRHGMVFSNIPGPTEQAFFAGQPVEGFQATFLNSIPQVILFSYAGKIFSNMVVDPEVMPDSESFGRYYLEELTELGRELGVKDGPLDF